LRFPALKKGLTTLFNGKGVIKEEKDIDVLEEEDKTQGAETSPFFLP
tara:strand:+ start:283 stop:423 length:141 start_codon:yes stop_codon:yes gene_type:complete